MSPGRATLEVEQPGGCHRIAEAGRQGVEPLIVEVDHATCEWTGSDCSTSVVACPIKHIPETDHPRAGELIIAANLTAASKARIVSRDFHTSKGRIAAAKYPADVGADGEDDVGLGDIADDARNKVPGEFVRSLAQEWNFAVSRLLKRRVSRAGWLRIWRTVYRGSSSI